MKLERIDATEATDEDTQVGQDLPTLEPADTVTIDRVATDLVANTTTTPEGSDMEGITGIDMLDAGPPCASPSQADLNVADIDHTLSAQASPGFGNVLSLAPNGAMMHTPAAHGDEGGMEIGDEEQAFGGHAKDASGSNEGSMHHNPVALSALSEAHHHSGCFSFIVAARRWCDKWSQRKSKFVLFGTFFG